MFFVFFSSLGKSLFAHPNDFVHVHVFVKLDQTSHEGHRGKYTYLVKSSLSAVAALEYFLEECLMTEAIVVPPTLPKDIDRLNGNSIGVDRFECQC